VALGDPEELYEELVPKVGLWQRSSSQVLKRRLALLKTKTLIPVGHDETHRKHIYLSVLKKTQRN
jgi:hypothetical protein